MRPHWIQSIYPSEFNEVVVGEENEFNLLPDADTMFMLSWLTRFYLVAISLSSPAGATTNNRQVSDGEFYDNGSGTGYVDELEKIKARRTGAHENLSLSGLPEYTTYWNDWAVVGYTVEVEDEWKPHVFFSFQDSDEQPILYSFDDGTRVISGATFTFFGQEYPMYESFGDGTYFSGSVTIGPDFSTAPFWPYKRADGTNPVRNTSTGAQLISDPVELNIQ